MHHFQEKIKKIVRGCVSTKNKRLVVSVFFFVVIVGIIFSINKTSLRAQINTSVRAFSGYAWSSNIGWIGFSGTSTDGALYGVTADNSGNLSGYAWSSNIGWISFNAEDIVNCPTMPDCSSKIDTSNKMTGWARALSASGNGWNGWIHLNGTASDNTSYGVSLNGSPSYAWGSNVLGWIDFKGVNVNGSNICPQDAYDSITVAPNTAISRDISHFTGDSSNDGDVLSSGDGVLSPQYIRSQGKVVGTSTTVMGNHNPMIITFPARGTCSAYKYILTVNVALFENNSKAFGIKSGDCTATTSAGWKWTTSSNSTVRITLPKGASACMYWNPNGEVCTNPLGLTSSSTGAALAQNLTITRNYLLQCPSETRRVGVVIYSVHEF